MKVKLHTGCSATEIYGIYLGEQWPIMASSWMERPDANANDDEPRQRHTRRDAEH
jgi:hypothetical protein